MCHIFTVQRTFILVAEITLWAFFQKPISSQQLIVHCTNVKYTVAMSVEMDFIEKETLIKSELLDTFIARKAYNYHRHYLKRHTRIIYKSIGAMFSFLHSFFQKRALFLVEVSMACRRDYVSFLPSKMSSFSRISQTEDSKIISIRGL